MSVDNFDKAISQLYQQRKNEIIAPNVDVCIHTKSVKNKRSLSKLFAIFSVGSAASFGIFAIISHLAKTPQVAIGNLNVNHEIEIKKIPKEEVTENSVVVKQILPPKPVKSEVKKLQALPPQEPRVLNEFSELDLNSAQIQVVTIPKIKEPKLILKPIFKIMPKYSIKALQADESGEIRLRYQINSQGKVEGVEVITSSVGRLLKKSAVQALVKWQYESSDNYQDHYEIIFDFNVNK